MEFTAEQSIKDLPAGDYRYSISIMGGDAGTTDIYAYIKINGEYYWVDITWDDAGKGNPTSHTYFLFNDEMQAQTRYLDWDQNFGPVCDSLTDNYFVKNGLYFEKYDRDAVGEKIENCSDSMIELRFADFDTYKEAVDDLIGSKKLGKFFSSSYSYYRDDRSYVLSVFL